MLAVCRPLHIAVAKGTAAAVESIISVMLSVGISLDYCNNRHQVSCCMDFETNPDLNSNLNATHNAVACCLAVYCV